MKIAVLALALWSGIVQVDGVVQGAVQHLRSPVLDPVMHAATDLGHRETFLAAMLGVAVFGGWAGPAAVREALIAVGITNLAVDGLKLAVGRTRPDGDRNRANSSFPSGHAGGAAAVAAVFSRRWRRLLPLFWGLAALVAFSRVYLNRHYASDVVVATVLGIAGAWCVPHVMRWGRTAIARMRERFGARRAPPEDHGDLRAA